MTAGERDALIEAGVTAYRERDTDGRLRPPSEWWDLAPDALDELYSRQLEARRIERLIDRREAV